MVYKYLGWGITNENGVAKLDHDANGDEIQHSYTGVGAGEIDVVASLDKPIVDGSIVSETFVVLDTLYHDEMTSDTTNNYSKLSCSLVFNTDNLLATRTADGDCFIEIEPTGNLLNNHLGKTVKFECEIIQATANVKLRIFQLINGSWNFIESSAKSTGNLEISSASISNSATRVRYRLFLADLGTNGTCSFKNFRVYPI